MGFSKFFWGLLAVALLLAGAGCSGADKPVKVEGTVTLDGKPLAGATVSFEPEDQQGGHSANGFTDKDGHFKLTTYNTGDGALRGNYNVVVTKTEAAEGSGAPAGSQEDIKKFMREGGYLKSLAKAQTQAKAPKKSVPARYGRADKTPLKYTVPISGELIIALTSD